MKKHVSFTLPRAPARTAVPERSASAFVQAEARGRRARGERLVVYVPEELATRLRVRCAEERRSLSEAVTEALEAWERIEGNDR